MHTYSPSARCLILSHPNTPHPTPHSLTPTPKLHHPFLLSPLFAPFKKPLQECPLPLSPLCTSHSSPESYTIPPSISISISLTVLNPLPNRRYVFLFPLPIVSLLANFRLPLLNIPWGELGDDNEEGMGMGMGERGEVLLLLLPKLISWGGINGKGDDKGGGDTMVMVCPDEEVGIRWGGCGRFGVVDTVEDGDVGMEKGDASLWGVKVGEAA
ncbi:MAG: hypothetical protein Q9171_006885 [Xanthocarpia ochracea]